MTQTAFTVNPLIRAGPTVLVVSGTLLEPNMASALTRLKLGMVRVIAINGLPAHALQAGLRAARDDVAPDPRRVVRVGVRDRTLLLLGAAYVYLSGTARAATGSG